MTFYQQLSRYYDEIFAVNADEMGFITQLLPTRGVLLDIGCGTGNKTVQLSPGAAAVTGIDMDAGMIARARADNSRANIQYAVLDMADIGTAFQGRFFDGVLCLGNTLVHLPSPGRIRELLATIHSLLGKGGVFILQILNYDRIPADTPSDLPLLDTPNTRFARRYVWVDTELHFVTSLQVKATGQTLNSDIVLYPLRKAELTTMLTSAGFGRPDYFGSYHGGAHQEDSFVTIACCRKS